jgi:hypothetical protein
VAKRKLPRHLEIRNECRKKEGLEPGQREIPEVRAKIEACVLRRTGKK